MNQIDTLQTDLLQILRRENEAHMDDLKQMKRDLGQLRNYIQAIETKIQTWIDTEQPMMIYEADFIILKARQIRDLEQQMKIRSREIQRTMWFMNQIDRIVENAS